MQTIFTPVAHPNFWIALKVLRYAYPTLVFFYFFIALGVTVCYMQREKSLNQDQYVRRGLILCLIAGLTGTYAIEIVVAITSSSVEGWNPGQDRVVYLISSLLVFMVEIIALADTTFPEWYPYYGTWFIGLFVELCLIIFPNVFDPPTGSAFGYILLTVKSIRILNLIALLTVYFYLCNSDKTQDSADAERQSLLKNPSGPSSSGSSTLNGNSYGTTDQATVQGSHSGEDDSDTASMASEDSYLERQRKSEEAVAKRLEQEGNWWTYLKGFSMFIPFIWPVNNRKLQARAVLVAMTLLASNALNFLVLIQFGIMVQSLITYTGGDHSHNVWIPVLLYSLLRFINGGSCLDVVRTWLWNPLEQYAYKTLSSAAHSHIMSLSSDFHDSKSSSNLFQVVNGGRSVADLMEMLCFRVIPMLIDLVIAFIYFGAFGPYMFLVLVVTFVSYMYATVKLISMRANQRRDYITFYRKEWTVGQESLDGWTTANLFNMVPYENKRYSGAIKEHIDSKWAHEWFYNITNMAKSLIMCFGLTGVLCLGSYSVIYEGQTVGKFTTLLMFWGQLQGPLVFLANAYRTISSSLIDAERLLELFKAEPSIKETPGAKDLEISKCEVEFNEVCFSYDQRKPILKNVSFFAPGGKTVAFVGETGGGKSTMLKLMDRFYDVNSGSIKIDGQDIRHITMHSLRSHVGVVPQDPTLFNDTIMNNIRYARLDATDDEVYEACKAAAIHDKILKLADGYNSKVGNRGVKLSGGEKQRVAIARAILKQPTIILLDEATSAVDIETEQKIQEGLKALCKDRTTFIVAHRLSTVMNADHIVVIMDGQIVEQGSHDELFHSKGKYADLWAKQIFVKPSNMKSRSRSRSKSLPKKDATIVNDLTEQKKTVNLAKAAKRVKDHNHTQDDREEPENGTNSSSQPKYEPKRKEDALKPAPMLLKPNSSKLSATSHEGSKLFQSKSELKGALNLTQTKQLLGDTPRPVPAHRPITAPIPATIPPPPATTTPHPATTTPRPYSPQRKRVSAQTIDQPSKAQLAGSPPRPPILSQPRSLFCTGNLPLPIHAKNMFEHSNPWTEEHPCQSPSSTHSMLSHTGLKHEKMNEECKSESAKAETGKIEGNVQEKVDKLDKGLPKGFSRDAMFIQLPKKANVQIKEKQCKSSVSESTVKSTASELTPLLPSTESPIRTSPKTSGYKKEIRDINKGQKRQSAKEKRKAASSSQTISEQVEAISQVPSVEFATANPGSPIKVQTKEAIREQKRREKEERKSESLRKKEESIRKKAEKKLKRYGIGNFVAAGNEGDVMSYGTTISDFATANKSMNEDFKEGNKNTKSVFMGGGADGVVESYIDDIQIRNEMEIEMGIRDAMIPTPAHVLADSEYQRRNRRRDSKSEPRSTVTFDLDAAHADARETQAVMALNDREGITTIGISEESTNALVKIPQINRESGSEIETRIGSGTGTGIRIGNTKPTERKGILKNAAPQEKRRVSAPARESVMYDMDRYRDRDMDVRRRRERVPTPMAMVGGLIGPGLGGFGMGGGVPVREGWEEREERGLVGPPVSLNLLRGEGLCGLQGVQGEGNRARKFFIGGGGGGVLMRGKKRQWRIRGRVVRGEEMGVGEETVGSVDGAEGMGMRMDGAGGSGGGVGVEEGSSVMDGKSNGEAAGGVQRGDANGCRNGNGKGKGKARGSVRFADDV